MMDNYLKIEKVGEGTYGVVFKARHKITGKMVAIKKIRCDGEDEGLPATTLREISLLKELVHPNVVSLLEVLTDETRTYLIFEYMNMDLKHYLDCCEKKFMPESQVKSFLYQITQAILFCHRRRVLHRDLKPQNLLVGNKGIIKLADFGLGRAIGVPVRSYTHEIVTLWYRAPEVLLGVDRYACPVDIWSIGCIFAEMAMKKALFKGDSEIDQLFRIFRTLTTPTENIWPGVNALPDFKSTFPKWNICTLESQIKNISPVGIDLLKKMLIYNPIKRISAKDAVRHAYFEKLDKTKLPNYENYL